MKQKLTFCIFFVLFITGNIWAQTWPPAGIQGNGTQGNPWQIRNISDLQSLSSYVENDGGNLTSGKYYKLIADIDMSGVSFMTIGVDLASQYAETRSFQGVFDGNAHKIKNLTVSVATRYSAGLFGRTYRATIKNLGLENCDVTGRTSTGALVGVSSNTTIQNCYATGSVRDTTYRNGRVGGLVGLADGGSLIQNCYANINVTTDGIGAFMGGLVGMNQGTIRNAYAAGSVTANYSGCYVGGVVGGNSGTIQNVVAANSSVTSVAAASYINRVVGYNISTVYNSHALSTMTVKDNNTVVTRSDGTTQTDATLKSLSFYNTGSNWKDNAAWDIARDEFKIWQLATDGALPVLTLKSGLADIFCGGNGSTAATAYEICTPKQLLDFAAYVNAGNGNATNGKFYKLTTNLDLEGWGDASGWTPIGNSTSTSDYTKMFQGTFDGGGHIIKNLNIARATTSNVGLFGATFHAAIKNIGVVSGNIIGFSNVGGLVGYAGSTTFENVYTNCTVNGTSNVGGLLGFGEGVSIAYSYASGNISGREAVGGLAGRITTTSKIENSLAANEIISAFMTSINRLVGDGAGATFNRNYALNTMNIMVNSATATRADDNTVNGTGKGTGDLYSYDFYTTASGSWYQGGWSIAHQGANDDTKVWKILSGFDLPYFTNEGTLPSNLFCGGDGLTPETAIEICTVQDLLELRDLLKNSYGLQTQGKYYKLMNDLDLGMYATGQGWEPIGTNETGKYFLGTFDGGGHTISNLYINRPSTDNVGLFGHIRGATVKNLNITGVKVVGKENVGGLVGYNRATIENCNVAIDTLKGLNNVGGLVGLNYLSTISNSYAIGSVSATGNSACVGGLVGYNHFNSTIQSSYATGSVSATGSSARVGGLVGYNSSSSTIKNCVVANASVSATQSTTYINRVLGRNDAGAYIVNNYAWEGMPVSSGGTTQVITGNLNGLSGADTTLATLQSGSFYSTAGNWSSNAWDMATDNTKTWNVWDGKSFPYFPTQSTPIAYEIGMQTGNKFTYELKNAVDSIVFVKKNNPAFKHTEATAVAAGVHTLTSLLLTAGDTLIIKAYEPDKLPSYPVQMAYNGVMQVTASNTTQCNGETFARFNFSGTNGAKRFEWFATVPADATAIGMQTLGTDSIKTFTAVNTSAVAKTVTIKVVPKDPQDPHCVISGDTLSFTITVKPTPTLASSATLAAICSQAQFSYTPTSEMPGTSYAWSRAAVAGISNAAASGTDNPNEVLANTTSQPVTVTYAYTLTANGCSSSAQNVTVVVNPIPALTSSATPPTICNQTRFSYTPTSQTAGTSYAWSRAAVAGISNAAASGTGNPDEILANTTLLPVTVSYAYTLAANGCSSSVQNVMVTVDPLATQFTTQPQGGVYGAVANFSVEADGAISYKWYKNNTEIGGQATNACPVDGVGDYYAVAAAGCGNITSSVASVTPKSITVTALGGNSTYGDSPSNPGLECNDLVNGEDISVLTGLSNSFGIDNTTDASAMPYTFTVEGTLSNTNYTLGNTVNGAWTVNPKGITVTALVETIDYGQTPALAYDVTPALINGDQMNGSLAVDNFEIGTHTITQGTLTAGNNYTVNYVSATLTILSTDISVNITINGVATERNGNDFSIMAECGDNEVIINVTADVDDIVTINGVQQNPYTYTLPQYGKQTVPVTITNQNGDTQHYTVTINKPIANDIFVHMWKDVLMVPSTYQGIDCNKVEWYKEGQSEPLPRDTEKGYLKITETGKYYAIINDMYTTCSYAIAPSDVQLKVYPNPTVNQLTMNNEQLIIDKIQVFDSNGKLIMEPTTNPFDMSSLPAGIYIVKVNNKTVKVVKE